MKIQQVAVGVVKNTAGQVLIALRPDTVHQGGLWEFPGGKVEAFETNQQALQRELKEELDITVLVTVPLITVIHQYPDVTVQLNVFLVEHFLGEARGNEGQRCQWVNSHDLSQYAFPAANQPIITAVQLPRYYAILNESDASILLQKLKKILDKGVKLIQARLKNLPVTTVNTFMQHAYPLCQHYGALLLINSAVEQTATFKTDGLHLTSQHLMAMAERPRLQITEDQPKQWLAASCHNLQELQHAQRIGVDFVVLAPVLPTKTHPEAMPIGWQQFSQWVSQTNLPVYALGGLVETDLMPALQAGGQGIAAIRAFSD